MVTELLDWVVIGVDDVNAGPFFWSLYNGVGYRYRIIGGRLVYIPTKDSDVYLAAIASWKAQMAAA